MTDLKKSIINGRDSVFTIAVAGAAETGDYLGDTAGTEGVPMPAGHIDMATHNFGTADATGIDATVHNVTKGTSATISFVASTFDKQTLDLFFEEGDELTFEITAVDGTTPGADGTITLHHTADLSPMN